MAVQRWFIHGKTANNFTPDYMLFSCNLLIYEYIFY